MSTPLPKGVHVCDCMRITVGILYNYLLDAGDEVPPDRKLSISKLAIMLRDEIDAAKQESPSVVARQDPQFQALKSQVAQEAAQKLPSLQGNQSWLRQFRSCAPPSSLFN